MSRKYKICKNCLNWEYMRKYNAFTGNYEFTGCKLNKFPTSFKGNEKCTDHKSNQRIKPIKNKR